MSEILWWSGVFVASLIVLLKASDYFIDNSEKVGLAFGIPSFIVGITIVAFGTSLPELVASLFAVLKGETVIVAGNVVGSNVTNVLLVMGTVSVIGSHLRLGFKMNLADTLAFFGSALFMTYACWDGQFVFWEALVCFVALVTYLGSIFFGDRDGDGEELEEKTKLDWYVIPVIALSAFMIYLGASYNVDAIINLSELLNIGSEVIALSVVALGTSLPELIVSLAAVRKGNADMAAGNVLGSNIFNILAVMGITGLVDNLEIAPSVMNFSIWVMIAAAAAFYAIVRIKQLNRIMGVALLIMYAAFIVKIYM